MRNGIPLETLGYLHPPCSFMSIGFYLFPPTLAFIPLFGWPKQRNKGLWVFLVYLYFRLGWKLYLGDSAGDIEPSTRAHLGLSRRRSPSLLDRIPLWSLWTRDEWSAISAILLNILFTWSAQIVQSKKWLLWHANFWSTRGFQCCLQCILFSNRTRVSTCNKMCWPLSSPPGFSKRVAAIPLFPKLSFLARKTSNFEPSPHQEFFRPYLNDNQVSLIHLEPDGSHPLSFVWVKFLQTPFFHSSAAVPAAFETDFLDSTGGTSN